MSRSRSKLVCQDDGQGNHQHSEVKAEFDFRLKWGEEGIAAYLLSGWNSSSTSFLPMCLGQAGSSLSFSSAFQLSFPISLYYVAYILSVSNRIKSIFRC